MAITLLQMKETSDSTLTPWVIDEFVTDPLLEYLPFDNTVKAGGQGQSLSYSYNRVVKYGTAQTRALNTEYTPDMAETKRVTVDLKQFGGSFEIDRVLQKHEVQVIASRFQFEAEQKIKATRALFAHMFINGDAEGDPTQFTGIDKIVTGTSTEYIPAATVDISTAAAVEANAKDFMFDLRQALKPLNATPTFMLVNPDLFATFQSVADELTGFTTRKTDLGTEILSYGRIGILETGNRPGTNDPIIPTAADGTTSAYFVRLGLDGVHAVSPSGMSPVDVYMPDWSAPGAVKRGEVEMLGAVAVKDTRSIAAFRNIKVV
jgi:hypothetical protein